MSGSGGGSGSSSKNSQLHSRGSAGAKLVDESHMKSLRELCALPGNRICFECSQRGPTYVDTTIGSFICMTCSGLLRGITPPHRVKSISMATFTPEEIQFLKSRGNEYCRKVWLATYTARDSNLSSINNSTTKSGSGSTSSELESDRRNTLKSHMSAKYEQKRYWVDPTQIPGLEEIALQNAKALSNSTPTSTSSSTSGSGGGCSSSNSNRSPSLSSASSGSSLSQAQHTNGGSGVNGGVNANGTPSPILNNLRNNNNHNPLTLNHPCPPSSNQQQNRLVSSATMPDIKPLSSLFNGSGGSIPPPFNFINNLSSNHNDDKIINTNNPQHPHPSTNQPKDPWGNGESAANGFNANFANFDEAFSASSGGNNGNFDPFTKQRDVNQHHHPSVGVGIGDGGFAIFDKPLLPLSQNGGGSGHHPAGINNDLTNGHGGQGLGPGDRYAALKDLDELFKQGDTVVANNTNPVSSNGGGGLTSSASMPANLSSSLGSSNGWPIGNGHHQNHNQSSVPNPFSMFGTSPSNAAAHTNGWGPSNSNPHNPFATPPPSSSAPSWPSNSPFGASQGQHQHQQGHQHGPNNHFHQQQQQQQQSHLFQFGGNNGKQGANGMAFNPFTATATTAPTNPHNPFL